MFKKKGARILATVLAAAMTLTAAPVTFGNTAKAATTQKVSLGVEKIKAPETGQANKAWRGSYVWFESDDENPVKYRVLSTNEDKFGGNSLFLDCDSILYTHSFNSRSTSQNNWKNSQLRSRMNQESSLEYDGNFEKQAKDAILRSYIDSHDLSTGSGNGDVNEEAKTMFKDYAALSYDRFFAMDIEDLMNPKYGYYPGAAGNASRVKNGMDGTWWIRNAYAQESGSSFRFNNDNKQEAGYILADGSVGHEEVTDQHIGVSPAMNIKKENILLSTAVSGNTGETGTEYRLTLLDQNVDISLNSDQAKIRKRDVEVSLGGSRLGTSNGPKAYAMILSDYYLSSGDSDADVLYFGELQLEQDTRYAGIHEFKGYFQLPSGLNPNEWGHKYHVYLVAQEAEGDHQIAYGNITREIKRAQIIPHVADVFKDVKANDWFVKAVQYVYENNIMKGKGDYFGPNDGIQREEVVQVLYNHRNKPAVHISNPFSDVKSTGYYYKAVLWAKEIGIVDGYGNGKFGIGDNITREQLAVMLYNYAYEYEYSSKMYTNIYKQYKDNKKVSSWARTAMDWALSNGIMSGKGAQGSTASQMNLDPQGRATRAECASMMMKLLELN